MNASASIRVLLLVLFMAHCQLVSAASETPITVDTQKLLVSVDPAACRWSAEVKGSRCG